MVIRDKYNMYATHHQHRLRNNQTGLNRTWPLSPHLCIPHCDTVALWTLRVEIVLLAVVASLALPAILAEVIY